MFKEDDDNDNVTKKFDFMAQNPTVRDQHIKMGKQLEVSYGGIVRKKDDKEKRRRENKEKKRQKQGK